MTPHQRCCFQMSECSFVHLWSWQKDREEPEPPRNKHTLGTLAAAAAILHPANFGKERRLVRRRDLSVSSDDHVESVPS